MRFWEHFGVTLRALAAYGGNFGSILGIVLGLVWVSVGDFGSLDGHFAMIVESLWIYKGPSSKKHPFSAQILMILYSSGVNC